MDGRWSEKVLGIVAQYGVLIFSMMKCAKGDTRSYSTYEISQHFFILRIGGFKSNEYFVHNRLPYPFYEDIAPFTPGNFVFVVPIFSKLCNHLANYNHQ